MRDFIPYGRQSIEQEDIDAVIDVLKSDFLTQGAKVPEFEVAMASYCGAQHAVAVNSATSALHIAYLALGVKEGDCVWTSPITFVATSNAALMCGASVDFVDIDPATFNMCLDSLERQLVEASVSGHLPKVVVPVHMAGQSCDMQRLAGLASKYGFFIVEDASHAVGGSYKFNKVGSCAFSDITVFSFHPVKIITTGEGGMALTNDRVLADKMALLRSHGVTRDASQLEKSNPDLWYYEQLDLGYNYRMTDIAAALGISQLQRLDQFVSSRHKIAKRYDESLANLPVITPAQNEYAISSYHLYIIQLQHELADIRGHVFDYLRSAGIGVNLHYIPVYLQPYYARLGFTPGYCPNAERYYEQCISLPMFTEFRKEQQEFVVDRIACGIEKCVSQ